MRPVYNSRDISYKDPFGAVCCGQSVTLTLRPDPAEGFTACTVLLQQEFSGKQQEVSLPAVADTFTGCICAPEQPELVWYAFRFTRPDGCYVYLGKDGYCDGWPHRWQLTVYDPTLPTPQWFGDGVSYQIFPDRFCRLNVPDANGMVGHRVVHRQWDELPVVGPNATGRVLNNDFFGGSLNGIRSKLSYLQSLSVTTLYLCPIFESESNHRYNTADYLRIDPMLGTEEDFRLLCQEAEAHGIRILLDGVFNHNGSNSRYFNAEGFYPELGAAQSPDSPYYDWYRFTCWPREYDSWWGIDTLPAVEENHPAYRDFIIENENSVIRHWLRAGASGWRLDVADELPDDFIAQIRSVMLEEFPDSILIGEVWEDGSNKIAYDQRRRYLLGGETHGLMNYPFRTAALNWLTGGDAADFREEMETLRENYPRPAFFSCMNFLGTHDTPRILTVLGADRVPETKPQRAAYALSAEEQFRGISRLRLGAMLLYCFPGSPTVYYGDEVGMSGFEDPLNRQTYPWGRENSSLLDFYRTLGHLRRHRTSLQSGDISYLRAEGGILAFLRHTEQEQTLVVLNACQEARDVTLPWDHLLATDTLTGQQFFTWNGALHLTVPPMSGLILA